MEKEKKRQLKGKLLGFAHGHGFIFSEPEGDIYHVEQMDVFHISVDREAEEILKEGDEVAFDPDTNKGQKVAVNVKLVVAG